MGRRKNLYAKYGLIARRKSNKEKFKLISIVEFNKEGFSEELPFDFLKSRISDIEFYDIKKEEEILKLSLNCVKTASRIYSKKTIEFIVYDYRKES